MNISGSGRIGAGEYHEKISISGSGKLDGNVHCLALSCSGAVRGTGTVVIDEELHVSGSCHIDGDVKAHGVSVSGAVAVGKELHVKDKIRCSGSMVCDGKVKCATLSCSGRAQIGECEAEQITVRGPIHCRGLLNAETVDLAPAGHVGSIGGSEIRVHSEEKAPRRRARLPLLGRLIGASVDVLQVDEWIEGDVVALERTAAPKVVGRIVAIGEGCRIDLLQYSEEVEIHPDANVSKVEKI